MGPIPQENFPSCKVTTQYTSCNSINGLSLGATLLSCFTLTYLAPLKKYSLLTHWGRVMHICVSKLTIIGSDNGLSPDRHQAIIWTNAGILLIGPLGTNFSEILIEILTFSFKKMRLKVSSAKRRPFCLGLNVLMHSDLWVFVPTCCCFIELTLFTSSCDAWYHGDCITKMLEIL